ncbi:MAG TPA: ferritin family protein [Thermoanaerobaculia bacterium]|jgi:rubrerythrin|nr:ferritin family protein [Thermoanaerobaculia bacterium]
MARSFDDLSEREILALAIALEEEDARVYADFADALRATYPASARLFEQMQAEEEGHRTRLSEQFRQRFSEHVPLMRREDVKGFVRRPSPWLRRRVNPEAMRRQAEEMELETRRFYERSAARINDLGTRQLLGELAQAERLHYARAGALEEELLPAAVRDEEEAAQRRLFVLQIVQPGLAGLMDGSVSTLAPLFAAALATHDTWKAFLVGLAASIGAGISMGFAEGLSDDGSLTGRGHPWIRGAICGLMTTAGGLGHTLPFLVPDFRLAMAAATAVVAVELAVISWVRYRFMETPLVSAALQVFLGGVLVFATGLLIGGS